MADDDQEKNKSLEIHEKAADVQNNIVETLPKKEKFVEVVRDLDFEEKKGGKMVKEQSRKNTDVVKIVDAIAPEIMEGKIDEENIILKEHEAARIYEEYIEALKKDIPNIEDKIEWIKKMEVSKEKKETAIDGEENKDKENKDSKEVSKNCSNCGVEIQVGNKFCMKCGKKLEFEERVFETEREKKTAERQSSQLKVSEEITKSYKKGHPDAFNHLEAIATKNGFKKVLIDNLAKAVCVKPCITKDAVFYSPKHFSNHEKLIELNKDFAAKGADVLIKHEFSHFSKENEKNRVRLKNFIDKLTASKETKEKAKEIAKEKGITLQDAIKGLLDANKEFIEMQTDADSFSKNFESKEKFINDYATEGVYTSFLYHGKESLTADYEFGTETNFIKTDILKEISKREKEIKKDLLEKYNEKQKNVENDNTGKIIINNSNNENRETASFVKSKEEILRKSEEINKYEEEIKALRKDIPNVEYKTEGVAKEREKDKEDNREKSEKIKLKIEEFKQKAEKIKASDMEDWEKKGKIADLVIRFYSFSEKNNLGNQEILNMADYFNPDLVKRSTSGGDNDFAKKEGAFEDQSTAEAEEKEVKNLIGSIEVVFINKEGKKGELKEQYKEGAEKALKVINEENAYYGKFFNGTNVVSKVEFDESNDNYFANDEGKAVDIPLKNPENFEETLPILRHESFHEALRFKSSDNEKSAKEQLADNIKNGKDTNLKELGLGIETGKFKKFIEDKKDKISIFSAVDMHYMQVNQASHFENEIEEIIEEKLADEIMFRREKEENPEKAVENVIKAKTISLNNIAKNKGLNSYADMNHFARAGFKQFISNYYNTYRFLSRVSAEGGKKEEAEKFAQIAETGRKKMEDKILKMFEKKEWEDAMKESYGYTKEELLSDINELLEKFDK